jgi:hypothetical protein
LRRVILVCVFGSSWAAEESGSHGRFRSLYCPSMTDGELSIDLWDQAVSGTVQLPTIQLN